MSREKVKDSWLKWNNCTEKKGAEYGALDVNWSTRYELSIKRQDKDLGLALVFYMHRV